MFWMNNPRAVLGVSDIADWKEIKRAYKKLAGETHPDVGGDTETFKKINEAYNQLRAEIGHRQSSSFHADTSVSVDLTLEEMAFGCKKHVSIRGYETCDLCMGNGHPSESPRMPCLSCLGTGIHANSNSSRCMICSGTGSVPIVKCGKCQGQGVLTKHTGVDVGMPAGVRPGHTVCFENFGGTCARVRVQVFGLHHRVFKLDGDDLVMKHKINLIDAIRGGSVIVHGLDGREVSLPIKPGTQPGDCAVVEGFGMPNLRTKRIGDLRVVVQVDIPKRLSPRAARLVDELAYEFIRK